MSFSTRSNQRGFSLVELMVVVAIIGILASIAIPSVNKYMAKARQSEAKTNLSSLYTSEKAFYSEYNTYDHRFAAVGYTPEGQLRYNIGFTGAAGAGNGQAGIQNGYTTTPQDASFAALTYCGAGGNMNANGCTVLNGATGNPPPAIAPAMCAASPLGGQGSTTAPLTCTTQASTFRAGAAAQIQSSAAAQVDYWSIDETKVLRNVQSGIR